MSIGLARVTWALDKPALPLEKETAYQRPKWMDANVPAQINPPGIFMKPPSEILKKVQSK